MAHKRNRNWNFNKTKTQGKENQGDIKNNKNSPTSNTFSECQKAHPHVMPSLPKDHHGLPSPCPEVDPRTLIQTQENNFTFLPSSTFQDWLIEIRRILTQNYSFPFETPGRENNFIRYFCGVGNEYVKAHATPVGKLTLGDGNCLFRSISFYMFGFEQYHQHFRRSCTQFYFENSDIVHDRFTAHYESLGIDNITLENWEIERLPIQGTYAGSFAIFLLASLLNTEIVVCSVSKTSCEYITHPPIYHHHLYNPTS